MWCLTLCLLKGAVLLDEGSGNRWLDDLVGGDGHSVELAEARDQSGKPQGPVGLLLVNRVSRGCNTHLRHNGINQLTVRQRKVRVVIAGPNVSK